MEDETTVIIFNHKQKTWGKGDNLTEAISNCPKTTYNNLGSCSVILFLTKPENVKVSIFGDITFPESVKRIYLK